MSDIRGVIQMMVDNGEPDDKIQAVVNRYNKENPISPSDFNNNIEEENKLEFEKRKDTDFNTWYKDVFIPEQKKINPIFSKGTEEWDLPGSLSYGMSWTGVGINYIGDFFKNLTGYEAAGEEDDRYAKTIRHVSGIPEDLQDVSNVPDTRFFWEKTQGIDLDQAYKNWQNETKTDLPNNVYKENPTNDYRIVNEGTLLSYYELKPGIKGKNKNISISTYNKLKEEEIAKDPDLINIKKEEEKVVSKDLAAYEAEYIKAVKENNEGGIKHYFRKIKETGKESSVVPSDEVLVGEMIEYFKLKDERTKWGPSELDNVGRQIDEKIKNVSGFLKYYSEQEAQLLMTRKNLEMQKEPSKYVFSDEELNKHGIDIDDFHNYMNYSNNKHQFNINYEFGFDTDGNTTANSKLSIGNQEEFKADRINSYLNWKIGNIAKIKKQYDNLGITKDVKLLNALQISISTKKEDLDNRIKDAENLVKKINDGKLENNDHNRAILDRIIGDIQSIENSHNEDIVTYNNYLTDPRKSKLLDGYADLSKQYNNYQELYLTSTTNNTVLKERIAKAKLAPEAVDAYKKNPTFKNGVKAYGYVGLDMAENAINSATGLFTGTFGILQDVVANKFFNLSDEDRVTLMTNWTNLQDQYLELNRYDFGPMMSEDGSMNPWALPGQLTRTVADIFAMGGSSMLVRGGLRKMGTGGSWVAQKIGVGNTTAAKLLDGRFLKPITKKLVDGTSTFLGTTPVIFPERFRDAMSQISDDFTAEDALKYAWQATSVESAIELINPNIKMIERWGQFKAKDAMNWKLWKDGTNATKAWRIFSQTLTTVPRELIEENLQEFYGGQINALYNRIHDTEFHIPTANDYKAVNILTPMAVMVAGGIKTRAFTRMSSKYKMAQAALEDMPSFEKELGKQVELYEATNGKEGISPDEYERIINEVIEYRAIRDKLSMELLNNLTPDEQAEWVALVSQEANIEKQLKNTNLSPEEKANLEVDLDAVKTEMKNLGRRVQLTEASLKERQLIAKMLGLVQQLKDEESFPVGSPQSLEVIKEIEKLKKEINKVQQETPLYSFNNKTYDTEEEFLNAITEARENGFFKTNKNPLIKISYRVPNGHDVKIKAYEAMGKENAPDLNNYSGRILMSEREVQESEDFLNSPENSGKSENDLLNDLEQEKDASKRSQIEQALEYLRIKKRGYTFDGRTGGFVMTGKDIDWERSRRIALKRYTKAAQDVMEQIGAKTQVLSDDEIRILHPEAWKVGGRGFFTQELDEKGNVVGYTWVVNKDIAKRQKAFTTATHEMLHGILWSIINGPVRTIKDPQGNDVNVYMTEKGKELIKGFLKLLPKKQVNILNKALDKGQYRFNEYKDGVGVKGTEKAFEQYGEEYLNFYHDAVVNDKTIPLEENKSIIRKIIDYFNSIFKRETEGELTNIEIKTDKQLLQFLKTYNAQAIKGKFDAEIVKLAKISYKKFKEDSPEQEAYSRAVDVAVDNKPMVDDLGKMGWDNKTWKTTGAEFVQKEIVENGYFDRLIASRLKVPRSPEETKKFVKKVYSELTPDIKGFNEDLWGTEKENDSLFGYLMSRVGYRADAVYNREKTPEVLKKAKRIEDKTKEGEPVIQVAAEEVTTEFDETKPLTKSEKARILERFDVDLESVVGLDAVIMAEIEALVEQNPVNLEEKLDKIVIKQYVKIILDNMGKISKKKGKLDVSEEYKAFHALSYDQMIASLDLNTIKKNYGKLFNIKKLKREKDKKVDPVTGVVTYPGKGIYDVKIPSKAVWTKYFTEGSYTTLLERRRALAKIIAISKAEIAVDNYIEANSKDINTVTKAKLRSMFNAGKRQIDEQKSFDRVTYYSKAAEQTLPASINTLFKKIKAKQIKNKTYVDDGRVLEQAFADHFRDLGITGLRVKAETASEKGGAADITFIYEGVEENHEIKKYLEGVFMGSVLFSDLNIKTGKFKLANNVFNQLDMDNMLKILLPKIKEKIDYINSRILIYNETNNTDISPITGNIISGKPEYFPDEIYAEVHKDLAEIFQDESIIIDHYMNKTFTFEVDGKRVTVKAPVKSMTIGNLGTVRLSNESIFPNAPMLKAKSRARAALYTSGHVMRDGIKMRAFKVRIQLDIVEGLRSKNLVDITTKEGFDAAVGKPQFSEAIINYSPGLINISTATSNVRPIRQYSKEARGMSTFDFDETLIIEGENFITAKDPNTGEEIKISSENWPLEGPRYAEQGFEFDFTDFVNVRGGVEGPLLQKMKNQIKKFGSENVFVLTARPPQSATAIHEWLKTKDINIPFKNINGLGNSTGEAKAILMLEKFAEGYNDMYFVDDALPNVKAVKHALDQLDIKSKVQQARIKFSKEMDSEFNNILEDVAGIDANKRFSQAKARKRGEGKGRFRIFIPPSHEDFIGLLYNFMGKGKKGNQHRNFFEQALVKPLNRAYTELNAAKQAISNDYRNLIKKFPNIRKKLTKKTPDGDYTYADAIRVYLWDKAGFSIPGMSKTDIKELTDLINKNPDLKTFADAVGLISRQKEGYVKPKEEWEVGDIRTDLAEATMGIGRQQFFTEFIENADIIFSPENLNKIEAIYGANFREALEEMLYKIKNGRPRPTGSNRIVNRFIEWINGAVGSTMFINVRSSVLQQLSIVNFLNFGDNNIFKAAAAFANQKQFWNDYAKIFNSDFLKQRRSGIAFDVNGAELAQVVSKSKEPFRAAIRHLLSKGFILTQIGDSNAIAMGGATFYRNRVNTYLKQGLNKKDAEAKAWADFTAMAEMTQQSARPDMISQQQSSHLGKFILAFQNVTSQYNRLIKKAALDLINRRKTPPYKTQWQSDMSNISRIIYYGAIQNLIFYGLQTAVFAMAFDDDDEDKEFFEKKRDRIINGSIDSILRGMGVGGAIISVIKNAAINFAKEQDKTWGKSFDVLTKSLLELSPPIDIKSRKLTSFERTVGYKSNKQLMKEMELFDINNPIWDATTNLVEGTTNLPANRIHRLTTNTQEALDSRNAWWQRLALFLGWNKWELGVENEEIEIIKKEIKKNNKKVFPNNSYNKKKKKKSPYKEGYKTGY